MKKMKKNYDLAELEIVCFVSHDIITGSGEQGGQIPDTDGPGIGMPDPGWDVN